MTNSVSTSSAASPAKSASGVGRRIFIALGATITITLVSAGVGLLSFSGISGAFDTLRQERLGAVKLATRELELVAQIDGAISATLAANGVADLDAAATRFASTVEGLSEIVAVSSGHGKLSSMIDAAVLNQQMLLAARKAEFIAAEEGSAAIAEVARLAEVAEEQIHPLVEAATEELVSGLGAVSGASADLIRRLVEVDVRNVEYALRIRAAANLLAGASVASANTFDPAIKAIFADLATSAKHQIETAGATLASIDPEAGGALAASAKALAVAADDAISFKGGAAQQQTMLTMARDLDLQIDTLLDDKVFDLTIRTEEAISATDETLKSLITGPFAGMRNRFDIDSFVHEVVAGVYAVVSTDDPAAIAEAGAALQASRAELTNAAATSANIGPLSETVTALLALADPESGAPAMRLREVIARDEASVAAQATLEAMNELAEFARGVIVKAVDGIESAGEAVDETIATAETALGALAALSLLVGALAVFIVQGKVVRPLRALADRTRGLAKGDLSPVTGFEGRRDEIGAMGSALAIFQEKLVNLRESEREREARAAKDEAARKAQDAVVSGLRAGLARLADGDLTKSIDTPFTEEYEGLRADYNRAQSGLAGLIGDVVVKSKGINGGASEVNQAADALARRTESQAAALEETVAALKQLTDGLNAAAQDAGKADSFTTSASQDAQSSEQVVRRSLEAMKRIETSSNQINQIISVIDDIAFQTNLLALNAGVEAARAGEAGRGFAVVASEVRALAQRCTDAAKEIKELISQSSTHVSDGVELVTKTGDALEGIVRKVAEINTIISSISASSREQAGAVGEIMAAMDQLDEVTQRNAAMVEEMTAASHDLTGDSSQLSELVSRFRAPGAEMAARKPGAPASVAPKPKAPAAKAPAPRPAAPARSAAPQRALRVVAQQDKVAPRPAGAAPRPAPALKPVVQAEDANWEEF